jgi:hypothetical protein
MKISWCSWHFWGSLALIKTWIFHIILEKYCRLIGYYVGCIWLEMLLLFCMSLELFSSFSNIYLWRHVPLYVHCTCKTSIHSIAKLYIKIYFNINYIKHQPISCLQFPIRINVNFFFRSHIIIIIIIMNDILYERQYGMKFFTQWHILNLYPC